MIPWPLSKALLRTDRLRAEIMPPQSGSRYWRGPLNGFDAAALAHKGPTTTRSGLESLARDRCGKAEAARDEAMAAAARRRQALKTPRSHKRGASDQAQARVTAAGGVARIGSRRAELRPGIGIFSGSGALSPPAGGSPRPSSKLPKRRLSPRG